MRPEPSVRTVGRTAVVAAWLLVLGVAGRPIWAAVLLGAVLVLVWASPYVLASNRRPPVRAVIPRPRPATEPGQVRRAP
jgi:hypothetical protein